MLKWVFERVTGSGEAIETAIGYLPAEGAIDTAGLDVSTEDMSALLEVDAEGWNAAIPQIEAHFAQFGDHLPGELSSQLSAMRQRLANA